MAPILIDDKTCVSCVTNAGKYKCTKCYKYTCSLDCNKKHLVNHPEPEPKPQRELQEVYDDTTGEPNELKTLFRKYPKLRAQLRSIAAATDPPSAEDEFKRKRPGNNKAFWTKDMGYENGVKTLRRLMNGPDSEGLEEYYEWVRLEKARAADQEEARLRQETARRDAEAIGKLLREEKEA